MDFPKPWKDLWNKWDIRIFVLVSLLLQILLIMFASWRKRKASKSFALFIWSVYLLADWVAAFSLGLLCNSQGKSDCDNQNQMHGSSKVKTTSFAGASKHSSGAPYDDKLHALWAPFLLLHLGGPDTITAFAMEDNELWPRHFLGLLFEVGAAVYVFLLSIPTNPLLAPTLLMFLAGIIKYGERTYALYLASLDGFRDSMLGEPDPGPNYAKLMEEYAYKKECGVPARIEISEEPKDANTGQEAKLKYVPENNAPKLRDVQKLEEAHGFFKKFKGLIVELIFSFHERDESRAAFLEKSAQDAFKVVEFELSFVYDVLFTKAAVVNDLRGYMFRVICSFSIIAAFFIFFFLPKRHRFSELDISITYTLFGGALCLDAFAFFMLIRSDWTIVELEKRDFSEPIANFILKLPPRDRWSVTVTQHNLINYCIPASQSRFRRIMSRPTLNGKVVEMLHIETISRWTGIGAQLVDEMQYTWRENVTEALQEHIYEQLKKRAEGANDMKETRRMCSCRGHWALEERGYHGLFGYSVEVEFDESLLMWHIATDLCYYTEENSGKDDDDDKKHDDGKKNDEDACIPVKASMHRKFCKLLSDYLMYLLVMRPLMMSSSAVIGKIRYRDTCAETKNFFIRRPLEEAAKTLNWNSQEELQRIACENLLSVKTTAKPKDVKGDRSKSVLFDACILAKKLRKEIKVAKRWEIMSEVWIEMLAYAASRCPGIGHAQRLSKGGELLTFVWFLMTHLGLGEQYQIQAGHARAKLIVQK